MSVARHAKNVSGATFLSRIFGLVRDQLFAALIGAGFYADAFFVAFRIPNLLRDLFAEGALSNAFVPVFSDVKEKQAPQNSWGLANLVFGSILMIVGSLVLLGIVFAPTLVELMAPGFANFEGKTELTVWLTRLMFPFLLLVSLAALWMGILNVYEQFAVGAFAPVLFNVVSIFFGCAAVAFSLPPQKAVVWWSVGTLLGGVAQMAIHWPWIYKMGGSLRPTLKGFFSHPGLRRIGWLMVPALIANSGTQVNVLVNTILASKLEQGSASWLNYAFRLMQFPIGVFGVAISVVTLAYVSKSAAKNDPHQYKETLSQSLKLVLLLTVPCALGFWFFGLPIISLIYERGAFGPTDTVSTTHALQRYALGLPAYAAVKVLAPSFFALGSSRIPMMASLLGILVNVVFNLFVYQKLGHAGLALGTSLGMLCNLIFLHTMLEVRHGGLNWKKIGSMLIPLLVSGALMVLTLKVCLLFTPPLTTFIQKLLFTLPSIALAGLVYVGFLFLFNVDEAKMMVHVFQKRFKK